MNDPVIPAPVRSELAAGAFTLRSGTTVAYRGADVAPIVERFCSEVVRRTGLRPTPRAGNPEPNEPAVRIERVTTDEVGALPAPQGLSPTGDGPADERHSLAIDADGAVLRAAEPVGVARGLTTLIQLMASAPSIGGEVHLPGVGILDAPRYAWRGLSLDVARVLAGAAAIFPGRYIHIGGDEPWGMPHDLYASYVRRVREIVRSIGRRPLGWQESARAGLDAADVVQYWFTGIALPPSLPPEVRARMDADLALSGRDVETAVAASAPLIVSPLSHCYLDVAYAEPSADAAQTARRGRVGLRFYAPRTVEESFHWEPAVALGAGRGAHVAGVEAAVWAETISGFDDLSFLLLPRLPGVAHKAWSARATSWTDHRDRLARHGRLWAQDDLTYFRTTTVDWP
jgi:hexosaminidase